MQTTPKPSAAEDPPSSAAPARATGAFAGAADGLDPSDPDREAWTVLTAPAQSRTAAADRPVSTRRVVVQVIVAAMVAVALVGVAGSVISRHLAEQQSVHDAAATTDLLAESVVQPVLVDAVVTSPARATGVLDVIVRNRVLSSSLIRVKLWRPDGTILYSDDARLTGQRFDLDDEARHALLAPRTVAGVSDLRRPENQFERSRGKLLEVYRPVWTPTGEPLLLETYFKYSVVNDNSANLWRGFVGVMLSSLVAVFLLLLPLVWTLFERTRRAQRQRVAMMSRALEASRDERARIAASLHDGVAQQLAAASFATAGEAERAAAVGEVHLAERLHETASTIRASIAGVRSLLVDIYPPSLRSSGLTAALRDLASTAGTAGGGAIPVRLAIDGSVADALPPELQEAMYRVAHEALRNAVAHSGAREIAVSLRHRAGRVRLEVADDGVGIDAGVMAARAQEGHFGMRLMTDVAARCAGMLAVVGARTGGGRGTRVVFEVPAA